MKAKNYPLYDQLEASIDPSHVVNINVLANVVKKLPNCGPEGMEHAEEIIALIYHHALLTNSRLEQGLAFGGKRITATRGVIFDCTKLPPNLLQIIDRYVEMHV